MRERRTARSSCWIARPALVTERRIYFAARSRKSTGGFAHPRSAVHWPDYLRREGPRHLVLADRAPAATRGRAERACDPARRRRLRRRQCFRRAVRHPDRGAARRERAQVQPLPHHGALLAYP